MKDILSSKDIRAYTSKVGVSKAQNPSSRTRLLAFLAGMFISIGAMASIKVTLSMGDSPLAPIISSFCFTIGIVLVLIAGAELFTGNILLTVAYLDKKIRLKDMLVNWARVWFWNFLGAIFFALLSYYTMKSNTDYIKYFDKLIDIKTSFSFIEAIVLGVLCNILVSLSVWCSYASNEGAGKFLLSTFPVFIFVLLKYEHVVANMFYFSFHYIAGGETSILHSFLSSFLPVTIGNILGGMLIASIYKFAYKEN